MGKKMGKSPGAGQRDAVAFSLEEDYRDLISKLAARHYLTKTALLRKLLDNEAARLGMPTVAPVEAIRINQTYR